MKSNFNSFQRLSLSFFVTLIFLLNHVVSAHAQLKVTSIGRVHIGNEMTVYDPGNLITLGLFGRGTDTYRAGSKLAFGDFGQASSGSINVFIGEEGNTDSDKLQLHGSDGISFSVLGAGDYFVGRFQTDGTFHVRSTVTANSTIFSDVTLKKNVLGLNNLSVSQLLSNLHPVQFDWITTELEHQLSEVKNMHPTTPKEVERVKLMENSFTKQINTSAKHFGFIAQEMKEVFPNLVVEQENGLLAVNYVEIIPLIVQGMNEKDTQLKQLEKKVAELEKLIFQLQKDVKH